MNKIPCMIVNKLQYTTELRNKLFLMGYKELEEGISWCGINMDHYLVLDAFNKFGVIDASPNFEIHKYPNRKCILYNIELFLKESEKAMLEYKKEIKMEKSNLKLGYVVEIQFQKERQLFIINAISNGEWYFYNFKTQLMFSEVNDDLQLKFGESRIVKVFDRPKTTQHGFEISVYNRDLLWAYNDIKEISMEDIAEKFGIPVGDLRIKK